MLGKGSSPLRGTFLGHSWLRLMLARPHPCVWAIPGSALRRPGPTPMSGPFSRRMGAACPQPGPRLISLLYPMWSGTAQVAPEGQMWPSLTATLTLAFLQCPFMDERIMCLHSKIKSQALEFPDQ